MALFFGTGMVSPDNLKARSTGHAARAFPSRGALGVLVHDSAVQGTGLLRSTPLGPKPSALFNGAQLTTTDEQWFENVIAFPKQLNVGAVLAPQEIDFVIFNSDRFNSVTLDGIINNAGDGSGIIFQSVGTGATIDPLDSFTFTLRIETDGALNVDGNITVTLSGVNLTIPVTLQRLTVFPYVPESEIVETLRFSTSIMRSVKGVQENRLANMLVPEQQFRYNIAFNATSDRQRIENLLFNNHARAVGVPIWWEKMKVTAPIAVNDFTINVETTNFRDIRVGEPIFIYRTVTDFESLIVDSFTASTITFTTQFTKSFDANTGVYPVREAFISTNVNDRKEIVNRQTLEVNFRVRNNISLASAAQYTQYKGKPVVDEANVGQQFAGAFNRRMQVVDSGRGAFTQFAVEDRDQQVLNRGWYTRDHSELWKLRGLFHYLRGQQVSFWQPSFVNDLTLAADVSSSDVVLQVENVGYADFVQTRAPRNNILIRRKDGTKFGQQFLREITASAVAADTTKEDLTIDTSLGVNVTQEEIERIEYLFSVRLNTDTVRITHKDNLGQATVETPLKTVNVV